MNEVVNSGVMNIASLVVSVVVLLIGLILWFFINRASSRTNEQIELLEALLDQQKRQNALLRRLCEATNQRKQIKRPLRVKNRLMTKILFAWSPNDNPSSILSNPVVEGLLNSS